MSELKLCPFCGSHCEVINGDVVDTCAGQIWIGTWNNRPIEDALNARILELERQLADAEKERRAWQHDNHYLQELVAQHGATILKLTTDPLVGATTSLLEACQELVAYFVGIGLEEDEDGEPNPIIERARAAIAKVEPQP